jgi:imidazolonepropionase-like amidohydrolase
MHMQVGRIERGFLADVIAVDGDLTTGIAWGIRGKANTIPG